MKKRHCLIALLIVSAIVLGWRLAYQSQSVSASPVQPQVSKGNVSATVTLSGLYRLYPHSWGKTLSVHPELQEKSVTPPSAELSLRKSLDQLSSQLRLPVVCAEADPPDSTPVYLHPAAIICGPRSAPLEEALDQLRHSSEAQRPELLHDLAQLSDTRVESLLHWSLTQSSNAAERSAAAFELGNAQTHRSHVALVNALADGDEFVRDQARSAIQQNGGANMEALLRQAMLSPNKEQAMEAGDLLENALGLEVDPQFWARFTE